MPNVQQFVEQKMHGRHNKLCKIRMPSHPHTKHWVKSLQWKLVIVWVWTGEDLPGVLERPGYRRAERQWNTGQLETDVAECRGTYVGIVEIRRNGQQLSIRHDGDDDDDDD